MDGFIGGVTQGTTIVPFTVETHHTTKCSASICRQSQSCSHAVSVDDDTHTRTHARRSVWVFLLLCCQAWTHVLLPPRCQGGDPGPLPLPPWAPELPPSADCSACNARRRHRCHTIIWAGLELAGSEDSCVCLFFVFKKTVAGLLLLYCARRFRLRACAKH